MPLHDHVWSISVAADSDEEAVEKAVEKAMVIEEPDHLGDCAIVFNAADEVIALWYVPGA
jgi:hypothetical protein